MTNDNEDSWKGESQLPEHEQGEEWKPPEMKAAEESQAQWEVLMQKSEEFLLDLREKKAARKASGKDFNAFIKETAAISWTRDGIDYWLCHHPRMRHWTGYVRFPIRPLKELGYGGLLKYVPVYGGITWAEDSPDGTFVYGFNCAHADDMDYRDNFEQRMKKFKKTKRERDLIGTYKRRTLKWLRANLEIMAAGIKSAAQYEEAYLAAESNAEKAKIIDNFHNYLRAEALGDFDLLTNFGAMISLLTGDL